VFSFWPGQPISGLWFYHRTVLLEQDSVMVTFRINCCVYRF